MPDMALVTWMILTHETKVAMLCSMQLIFQGRDNKSVKVNISDGEITWHILRQEVS